jgi:hypothetical protein
VIEVVQSAFVGSVVGIFVFFGILALLAIGRWFGKRSIAKHGGTGPSTIGSLETAVFALLGLLIAFTFSGALQRFDARRAQVVDEANAVGTAWARLDLLAPAAQPPVRDAMKAYVGSRVATYQAIENLPEARTEAQRSLALQATLWSAAMAALRHPDTRPGTEILVVPALNEMFNFTTIRLTAMQMHPPRIVYVMLIGLALVSALLAGFQSAGERKPDWLHRIAFGGIIALTVYVVLEIEYPRSGFVRIDAIDEVLVNARDQLK